MIEEQYAASQENLLEEESSLVAVIERITAQFELIAGDPDQVKADCNRLRQHVSGPPSQSDLQHLQALLPLLGKRSGAIAAWLFSVFEDVAVASADPWPLLMGMLAARDADLAERALELTRRLAQSGALVVDRQVVRFFAERVAVEGSPFRERAALVKIADIVRQLSTTGESTDADPVVGLYLSDRETVIRRLAARLLDLNDQPVSTELAKQVLGSDAHQFFAPYLAYTRANHLDLLSIAPWLGHSPPALASLQSAEHECGETLLREVIARLGWARVNLGLQVQPRYGVSVNGSLPLIVSPAEARLLERVAETRCSAEYFMFFAHGGLLGETEQARKDSDPVARFRAYNLAHANLLADILDVAPLDREKVRHILNQMDGIVEDFTVLFAAHSDECAILPGLYQEIRQKVLSELDRGPDQPQLSAELTRLVRMFEDPRALGEVRTLHGLKRYLHQRGLRLGFRLLKASRATNRTVSIVVATPKRIISTFTNIRYADFEASEPDPRSLADIPYPIAIVADGFARQLFYGQDHLPRADIFCYGNEVHYFLGFLNHPAFLRIDYAPPLQGGMIDLEYFGVSKFELEAHPDLSLNAIKLFFQHLDFDTEIDGTHIHARFDKERALDLGDLCKKAEAIFRLAPYLMDLEWVIGSLKLDADARRTVAESWAGSFARWGVLPLRYLLTKDRQGVLEAKQAGPFDEHEAAWSGQGAYRSPFNVAAPSNFIENLHALLGEWQLETPAGLEAESDGFLSQLWLEQCLLSPLRQAVARGELIESQEAFLRASPELFQPEHEAECFAELLASSDDVLAGAITLAGVVRSLERFLSFQTTGSVDGCEVQAARLPLRGEGLRVYVLRDACGMIRLAMFARGDRLFRSRQHPSMPWISHHSCDAREFVSILRSHNYPLPGRESAAPEIQAEVQSLRRSLRETQPLLPRRSLVGGKVIQGLRAAPGRAVGRVLFGTTGRSPEDFNDRVLVAAAVRPEDNTFLYHAAGIVSTGGGILSHAGLIASQFHKPALIISGQWQQAGDGSLTLRYVTTDYQEQQRVVCDHRVTIRTGLRRLSHLLREGDLVILDAGEGTLSVLGQDRDALALYEGFRQFVTASRRLAEVSSEREILALRGKRLRAHHQVEKVLVRLTDPVLASYAVDDLMLGESWTAHAASRDQRAHLLALIVNNQRVGEVARQHLSETIREVGHRYLAQLQKMIRRVLRSTFIYEIVMLRLDLLRLYETLKSAVDAGVKSGLSAAAPDAEDIRRVDKLARRRLQELQTELRARVLESARAVAIDPQCRHLLTQLERAEALLGVAEEQRALSMRLRERLADTDAAARARLENRYVLGPSDGGAELFPLIGWKAANLAEAERLIGAGLIPPWFAVSDRAFQEVLDSPIEQIIPEPIESTQGTSTLRHAIDAVLTRHDLSNGQKSARIRDFWDRVILPVELREEVVAAYRQIRDQSDDTTIEPFVAIRSSAREEDAELAARPGEFETFLFIRGEEAVLDYLKRTWSGLWTERAIHNRSVMGTRLDRPGGGVIVQRIVCSRVSGVLQTINLAAGELREMVINAGLGLGEGIVSGTVGADQITVSKDDNLITGPLRFKYLTAEKSEQVVFNRRTGRGTIRTQTLYHQRLRPALEYVELCELVSLAARLEAAYGYPLDIEFGIEGTRLWLLQVRPVAVFLSALQETLERYPIVDK